MLMGGKKRRPHQRHLDFARDPNFSGDKGDAEHRRKMVVLVRKDDAFDAPGAAFDRISDRL